MSALAASSGSPRRFIPRNSPFPPNEAGRQSERRSRTAVRTNKSHYPPQRRLLGFTPAHAANQPTPRAETRDFSSEGQGKTGVVSRRPRPTLTTRHEFFEGVSAVAPRPFGIFFRRGRRRDDTLGVRRLRGTFEFYEWRRKWDREISLPSRKL